LPIELAKRKISIDKGREKRGGEKKESWSCSVD